MSEEQADTVEQIVEGTSPETEEPMDDSSANVENEAGEEAEDVPEGEGDEEVKEGEGGEDAEEGDVEEGEEGEDGEEKPKKRRKKKERSPSPPPRAKAPKRDPPAPPPKSYDVPNDTWSSKPVSNRVWEVEEEMGEYEQEQDTGLDLTTTELGKSYAIGKELGRGPFAVTKEITENSSGTKFAVKVIEKSMAPQFGDALKSELDILSKLDHENIVKGSKLFDMEGYLLVVLELAAGGEIQQVLASNQGKPYTEADVLRFAKQLVSAVAHMHEKEVVHGDLAPENLFLAGDENSKIKVGGFSNATVSSGSVDKQIIGNAEFQAPELVMNQDFTAKADMWSLGCILYSLVEGSSPFADSNNMRMNMKIRQGKFAFGDAWASVSDSLKDLISQLIKVNPDDRSDISAVQAHAWLKSSGNAALPTARANMAN